MSLVSSDLKPIGALHPFHEQLLFEYAALLRLMAEREPGEVRQVLINAAGAIDNFRQLRKFSEEFGR